MSTGTVITPYWRGWRKAPALTPNRRQQQTGGLPSCSPNDGPQRCHSCGGPGSYLETLTDEVGTILGHLPVVCSTCDGDGKQPSPLIS